jgi:hypothetical protein
VGAAHSRQSTTEDRGAPSGGGARSIRTTPFPRQSRACQHVVRRVHLHGPEAAERAGRSSLTSVNFSSGYRRDVDRGSRSRRTRSDVSFVHAVVRVFACGSFTKLTECIPWQPSCLELLSKRRGEAINSILLPRRVHVKHCHSSHLEVAYFRMPFNQNNSCNDDLPTRAVATKSTIVGVTAIGRHDVVRAG